MTTYTRGISSINIEYVEGILSNLSEKFLTPSNGVMKKRIPLNILNDIPAEGVDGLTLTTQDIIEMFVKNQQFFLYKDEYFAGFPCEQSTDFFYAVDYLQRELEKNPVVTYFSTNADNEIELITESFSVVNLPLQKHPMRIIANVCLSTADNDPRDTYEVEYTYNNTKVNKIKIVGRRDLEDIVKFINQSNAFTLNKFSTNSTEMINTMSVDYNVIEAIGFGN